MTYRIKGTFTCAANDSWDWIAMMFYHDETYAADLMNANPEYCGMSTFRGGEVLLIPEIPDTETTDEARMANTQAPWKE